MSWAVLLALAGCAYALKAVGPLGLGGRELRPAALQTLALLSVPLLAALIVVQTVTHGRALVLDARLPAVLIAAMLTWRRAPFLVVVVSAALVAALLRAV
mgnify:CR=1 FL=1